MTGKSKAALPRLKFSTKGVSKHDAALACDTLLRELKRREVAINSLIGFTKFTFPDYRIGTHHIQIAEALESVARGDLKRLMIFTPPRHGKSELASVRFPAWYLGRHPTRQVIVSSYSAKLANKFSRSSRRVVESKQYELLFPQVALAREIRNVGEWHVRSGENAPDGVCISSGVGGGITGHGAHLAIIDDPIKDQREASSITVNDAIEEWYQSVLYTRLMRGAAIILIMTRWNEGDLAGRLLSHDEESGGSDGWKVVKMEAIRDGKALWPEEFSLDDLERIKRTLGPRQWNSLYQQDPSPDEGAVFMREWFRSYSELPKNVKFYITHDDAVTDEAHVDRPPDFTEIAVWAISEDDDIYAVDWWSGRKSSSEWVGVLASFIGKYRPVRVVGESGVIRRATEPGIVKEMRDRKVFAVLEWLPSVGDKLVKAQMFIGLLSNGVVFFPMHKEWAKEVVEQLIKFPGGKFDDKVDACSFLGMFVDKLWKPKRKKTKEAPPSSLEPTLGQIAKRYG